MPTTRNIFEGTLDDLQRWNRREPITAAKLNQPVDALNRMGATLPRSEQVFGPGGAPTAGQDRSFRFVSVHRFVAANDVMKVLDKDNNDVFIALPWLLRRTPFHAEIRGAFRYAYFSSNDRRTSTRVADILDIETQAITPSYRTGDIIRAHTAVAPFVQYEGEDLQLEAVQDRHWAKEPE